MKNNLVVLFLFFLLSLSSCIVKSPKYSTLSQVMNLHLGMSKMQVEETLGIKPYNIKAITDSNIVFIYVYRPTERSTLSFNTKPVNGIAAIGKYVQLEVTYSKDDKVIKIESCNLCPDNLAATSTVNFEKIFIFITVTLPVILIFIGLK
jgi:hypothetical protein